MDDKLKELYGQLYDDTMKIKLSNFFPICGSEYSRENAVRLMAIGRAVDGWDEFNAGSKDEFLKLAERSMESRGFSWLGRTDPAGNYDDELASESYINRNGNEVHYNLRTSPFWRTVKEIARRLHGWDENTIPSRWYEYIIWNNLYAISPKDGGNPDDAMQKIQRSTCRALLREQIQEYAPTHILFVTGQDWFDTFWKDDPLCDITDFTDWQKPWKYPVSCGLYGDSKVVITMRPEFRTPSDIIDGAVAAFESLGRPKGSF